jgi:predicted metal-dependent phosphoesterase TrpH
MDSTDGVTDLHIHTVASDRTSTVDERVYQARQRDLNAIAITDHDAVSVDIQDRNTVADGFELIAGVEVRADVLDTKVELLGYFIDPDDERLTSILEEVRTYRRERNCQTTDRLH